MAGFPISGPHPMQQPILDALRRGAHDEALAAAREAAAERPDDAQAHRWLAVALAQAGQPAQALASIDRALELAPGEAELHLVRGSLLLAACKPDAARAALDQATGLDPNQVGAYFLQAQLALARGDADEAERQARLAARLAPAHPQHHVIAGMVALRRGDAETALRELTAASEAGMDEPQLTYALGLAHLRLGRTAFAEQAFVRSLERMPGADSLRPLIADLRMQQRRPADALEILRPLLERPQPAPALRRLAGILELEAGRPQEAVRWLQPALAENPRERALLGPLLDAWHQLGQGDQARTTLEQALAATPDDDALWEARLAFADAGERRAVVERWNDARQNHPPALEALAALHDEAGESGQAIALTRRVVELAPERLTSQLRLAGIEFVDAPAAAAARLRALLERHQAPAVRSMLYARLAEAEDRTGDQVANIGAWLARQREWQVEAQPLPEPVPAPAGWPAPGEADERAIALLWGPPGSGVQILANVAMRSGLPLLADRFGPNPPRDPLQSPQAAARLADGTLSPHDLAEQWRGQLPARGIGDGDAVIDWLPWWDNALLLALRPQLPAARLLVALRDPRDLLLNWLAFGSQPLLAIESPQAAARWLAGILGQVADLHEQDLQPHRLLRLDDADGPGALFDTLNIALDTDLPVPGQRHLPGPWLPAGRWRAYAEVLAEPFAELHAVAQRLGYPSD
jgi:tetratricopeptide (TPR) repeat protein